MIADKIVETAEFFKTEDNNVILSVSVPRGDHFNIFLISESKLDASFPKNQFKINGYKCFRRDRNKYGGGLMFYFNEGVPCKVLANQTISPNVEMMAIEFHQMKRKWLLLGVYKPSIQRDSVFTG